MNRALASILGVTLVAAGAFVVPHDAQAGGTCHKGQPVTEAHDPTVSLSNNCFVATITRVEVGATVTWVNEDEAAHTVTGANESWGNLDKLHLGDRFTQTFDASGVYPYHCFLHPGMIGVVVVGDGQGAGATTIGADGAIVAGRTDAELVSSARGESSAPSGAQPLVASDDSGTDVNLATASAIGVAALIGGAAAGAIVHARVRRGA